MFTTKAACLNITGATIIVRSEPPARLVEHIVPVDRTPVKFILGEDTVVGEHTWLKGATVHVESLGGIEPNTICRVYLTAQPGAAFMGPGAPMFGTGTKSLRIDGEFLTFNFQPSE